MLDTAEILIDNFILMIEVYGMIPNGFRKYFLNRSQPQFFSLMVKDLVDAFHHRGQLTRADSLEQRAFHPLNIEHDFFMATHSKKVKINGKEILLNFYNANTVLERPESFRQDNKLVENLETKERERVLKGLSSMAESGWDFSSRWLRDPKDLTTTQINDMIPSDLNTLLGKSEEYLINLCSKFKREDLSVYYLNLLNERKEYFTSFFDGVGFPDQVLSGESIRPR